jgi:hypothetical protein
MKRLVRLLGLALALGTLLWWGAEGANLGWTKTSVPKRITDDVTGIEAIVYEKRWVPGLDLLVAGLLSAGIVAGVSFIFRSQNKT